MSSAHAPKILRPDLVADVAVGGSIIAPPVVPTVSLKQAPVDILPDASLVKTEAITATRKGDTSRPSSVDWAVSAGPDPAVDGTDFGLAAGVFPTGRFDFPVGAKTASDQFNIAAKGPPTADKNAVFTLSRPSNAKVLGALKSTFLLQHAVAVVVPDITNIQQDSGKVFWVYTTPPGFTGFEIRTTTVKARGWTQCAVLVASQTAKQISKTSIPSGVVEVLVKATINGGQQSAVPARIDITGVVETTYPSGLTWLSGLNPAGDWAPGGFTMLDAFSTWRGRTVDLINIKANRAGTWSDLLGSLSGHAKDTPYASAFSRGMRVEQVVPLIAQTTGIYDLNACGNTNVNAPEVKFFLQTHTTIANYLNGLTKKKPYIIRLGHEMEDAQPAKGTGNKYSPLFDSDQTKFSHYILCMQRACDIYHTILGGPPDVYIDQCHLRTGMESIAWDKYFPGSAYVDIGGLDSYCTVTDAYKKPNTCKINNATDAAAYLDDVYATGHPRGPRAAADWCKARSIKFGIGEWGISTPENYPQYTNGAPGNPNDVAGTWYCKAMFDFFSAYADTLIYEAYFNVDDAPKSHLIVDYNSSTKKCSDYSKAPAASAAYRTRWTP
jgi:hypothetical protein